MSHGRFIEAPSLGAFLFIAMFGLYASTAAPSVTFWDSGELIAASCSLGIPHQPGYPLYSIVGRAFAFLPAGNAAFRANILSAAAAAASVCVLFLALRFMVAGREEMPSSRDSLTAAATASMFGVSKAFWTQAVVAEVYTLNALFITTLLYLHILNSRGRMGTFRYVCLSGLLFGLGTVNHITVGLLLPGLLASWLFALRGGSDRLKGLVAGATFGMFGMSVLIYLPIRSSTLPYINIGHPDTFGDFMWTVRWSEYLGQLFSLVSGAGGYFGMLVADAFILSLGAAGLVLFAAAAWALLRYEKRTYLPLMIFAAVYIPVTAGVALGSGRDVGFGLHEKFFIPAIAFVLIFFAGLAGTIYSGEPSAKRRALRYAVTVACLCASGYLLKSNLPAADYHRHFIAYDYAQNSFKSAGERGVLFTWGDNGVFPLWYVQGVERYRDDVVLVHTPLMTYGWFMDDVNSKMGMDVEYMQPYFLGENVFRIIKADPSRTACYDYSSIRYLKLAEGRLAPRGLLYYEGAVPPGDPWGWFVLRGVKNRDVPIGKLEDNIIQIYTYMARLEPA